MSNEKAQTIKKLRDKLLGQEDKNADKQRFGLFSSLPAGVIGDELYDFQKTKKLDQNGKVLTAPRFIFTNPSKTDKHPTSYFSKTAFLSEKDKYVDTDKQNRQYEQSKKNKGLSHDDSFKPADLAKSDPITTLFPHQAEFETKKKSFRGPDGKVKIGPTNMLVAGPKTGVGSRTVRHLLGPLPKHEKDEYDRPREFEKKERAAHHAKLQEEPFKSTIVGKKPFNSDKDTFGNKQPLPPKAIPNNAASLKKIHEDSWKPSNPSKSGIQGLLAAPAAYQGDPIHMAKRVKEVEGEAKKDRFKPPTIQSLSRPTPSVSLNKFNLKKESASFSAII